MVSALLLATLVGLSLAAFPPKFAFGVATAAYQIEGAWNVDGRGPSIWDTFSHIQGKTNNGDTGDVADDSYYRYPEDVQLMVDMRVRAYRFSISWSRIFPQGEGAVSEAGLRHYSALIDLLLSKNIVPYVTLYHWDLPQALDDKNAPNGGWLDPTIVKAFTDYADTVFSYYGDRVKHWITFNEPHEVTWQGYGSGLMAPGRCSDRSKCQLGNTDTEPYIAAHHILLSHAAAAALYKSKYAPTQRGVIGMTLNCDHYEPYDPANPEDVAAALRVYDFQLGWFANPLFYGAYPASMVQYVGSRLPSFTQEQSDSLLASHDIFGLNSYTSNYAVPNMNPTPGSGPNSDRHADTRADRNGVLIGQQADSTWLYVVPWGIQKVLQHVHNFYKNPIIYITENGVDVPKEGSLPIDQVVNDTFRVDFLQGYLSYIEKAITDDHINVQGYFVWSLLDNFEWADGYSKRFGVHYVDYKNGMARTPKNSARWYADFIAKQP
jgi:beta-glucosidase